jgi:lysophospholipase L1-like esterase
VVAGTISLFVACGGDPNPDPTPQDDAGTSSAPDAGTQPTDAGDQKPDSGTQQPDAGTQEPDAGTQQPDAGTQEPDAGTQEPDAGTQEPDAGTQEPDAGNQEPDAGTQQPDAGTQEPDAGTQQPDAGTPEPELTTFSPYDYRIQYTGRINFSSSEPWFSQPGVSIKARFTGSTLNFLMKDLASGGERTTNYYNVVIDDGAPIRFKVLGDTKPYEVANNLAPGEHTVLITKRTEGEVGSSRFFGFQVRGTLLEPPPRPTKRLEFIGDSMTCGYGNQVSIPEPPAGNPNTGFHSINENHDQSFTTFTARALGAESMTICHGGRGVYRNYDGTFHDTVPLLYERIIPYQPQPTWDFRSYTPDVVLINLGTNDLNAPAADELAFKKAYKDLVTRVRGNYPNAKIVCVVGVMLSDYYPTGEKAWTKAQTWTSSIVQDFNAQGDTQVYYLKLNPHNAPYGEDWHPTVETHQQMANTIAAYLRTLMGW